MGGRGSSTGVSDHGIPYGREYHSLLTVGNIKFVVKLSGSTTAPMETMTKGRVYVLLFTADFSLTPHRRIFQSYLPLFSC